MTLEVRKNCNKRRPCEGNRGHAADSQLYRHTPAPQPVRTRRISAEKAIIRFTGRGLLNFAEAKAAFAFLSLVNRIEGHPVRARVMTRIQEKSGRYKGASENRQASGLSAKQHYEYWWRVMLDHGLEPLVVVDYVLNGTPFSGLDKKSRKRKGWAMQQYVEGMRIFRRIILKKYIIDTTE